jgi:hypothetical protein
LFRLRALLALRLGELPLETSYWGRLGLEDGGEDAQRRDQRRAAQRVLAPASTTACRSREAYVSKFSHMRVEPSGLTNDEDIRVAKSIVDYIFRWMGKKFLTPDQQEEAGMLSAEVKARLAAAYANGGNAPGVNTAETGAVEATPGQTALFNQ